MVLWQVLESTTNRCSDQEGENAFTSDLRILIFIGEDLLTLNLLDPPRLYYLVRHLCGTWCLLPLSSCTLQITFRWKVNVLVSFYPHYTAYQFTSKWSIFSPYRCKSSSSTTRKETCFGGILWQAWSLRSSLIILHGEMFYRSHRFCGKASWIRILHNIYLKFLRTIVLLPFRYFFSYVGRLMLSSLNHCTVRLTGDSKNSGYKR